MLRALLILLVLTGAGRAADCPRPANLRFEVTGKIVRSEVGFTQGLEWRDGKLYESTGAIGDHSGLNTIAPDGTVTRLRDDGTRYFGEGLTVLNDEIYQLTWTEKDVFVYDLAGQLKRQMRNPREGWGLTHDDDDLIASDGSSRLFFLSPRDFSTRRVLPVVQGRSYVENINELEYVQGAIWANVFEDWVLLRISPTPPQQSASLWCAAGLGSETSSNTFS